MIVKLNKTDIAMARLIASYFIAIIDCATKVEQKRRQVAAMKDFDISQMFKELLKFEKAGDRSVLTLKGLMSFLEANKIKSANEHLLIM